MKFLSFTKLIIISAVLFFVLPNQSFAIYDPLSVANNRYGIHIIDENDLENASALVNSSGGDWGYVTIVIPENGRSVAKWQPIFDKMKEYHLIPIVRLATIAEGPVWKKPETGDAENWANFLNQLNWFTKNRYIILFNEPNHSQEWGGSVNPEEYGNIVEAFSTSLRNKSSDFYILPAGLDASVPNSKNSMDEIVFLKTLFVQKPNFSDLIDGWTSHSYPNPGFSGSVRAIGRGTLRTFEWELELLHRLGISKTFSVFITETGWAHQDGSSQNKSLYDETTVAGLYDAAAKTVWSERNVVAVTPFLLNYISYPFTNFSWQKPDKSFYLQYESYQSIPKEKGQPKMIEDPTPTLYKTLPKGEVEGVTMKQNPVSIGLFKSMIVKKLVEALANFSHVFSRS